MKKPTKCITPKRNHEFYTLTAKDFRNLASLIKQANDILSYYVNMPENETGELATKRVDELEELCEAVEDLKATIWDVIWLN